MNVIKWVVILAVVAVVALAGYNYVTTGEISLNLPGNSVPGNKGIKL